MQEDTLDPDWSTTVSVNLSVGQVAHVLFSSAGQIHTGWDSCVEADLAVFELNAIDNNNAENHARLVELEYEEDDQPGVVWHDWTVELKLGSLYLAAHWRALVTAPGAEWEWCAREARKAFTGACILVGKRVTEGVAIEEMPGVLPEVRH